METVVEITGLALMLLVSSRMALGVGRFAAQTFHDAKVERRELASLRAVFERQQKISASAHQSQVQQARPFQVIARQNETPGQSVCSFYLAPTDGAPVPAFKAGQFVTLELAVPGQSEPVRRCYSISSSPNERRYYRITVKRVGMPAGAADVPVGFLSNLMHDRLEVGMVVHVLPPAGAFCLEHGASRPLVFVAGGVGLTPLLSMLQSLVEEGSRRKIILFYSVRNRDDHAMYDGLHALQHARPDIRIITYYSAPLPTCQVGVDFDVAGRITCDAMLAEAQMCDAEFYLCGPEEMIQSLRRDLRQAGVADVDIKTEMFSSPGRQMCSSKPVTSNGVASTPINVRFARSRTASRWTKSTASLLELAEANGIQAPYGCRAGACGTCKTKLIAGTVDYMRQPAVQLDPGTCLLCVTCPTSDVVIDV